MCMIYRVIPLRIKESSAMNTKYQYRVIMHHCHSHEKGIQTYYNINININMDLRTSTEPAEEFAQMTIGAKFNPYPLYCCINLNSENS